MTGLRVIARESHHQSGSAAVRPVLGLCVGMQILFARGVEFGVETKGCGQWACAVTRLDAPVIPHIVLNVVACGSGQTARSKGLAPTRAVLLS